MTLRLNGALGSIIYITYILPGLYLGSRRDEIVVALELELFRGTFTMWNLYENYSKPLWTQIARNTFRE